MAGEGGAIFNTALGAAGSMVIAGAKGHQGRKFARENREYATNLANTAYQRATTDMEAAGLNPMLMYGSGSAAGTVQGAQPDMGAPMGLDSSSARRVSAEMRNLTQQTRKTSAEASLLEKGIPRAKAEAELWQWGVDEFMPFARQMMQGISDEVGSARQARENKNRPRAPQDWPIVTKDNSFMTEAERKKAMKKLRPRGGGRYR